MIAPLRNPDSSETDSLTRARRYVADTLLSRRVHRAAAVPAIGSWKAWLFVGWLILVAWYYLGHMR